MLDSSNSQDLLNKTVRNNEDEQTTRTDALKVNNKERLPEVVPAIVIKTRNKEADKICVQIVKKNITANTSAQIKNVLSTKSGSVVVKCKYKQDVARTKAVLAEKLGDNYEVEQEKMCAPKIKIYDIDSDMDKEELMEDIFLKISGIYRCHDIDKDEFIRNLSSYIDANSKVKNHILVGDFNINLNNTDCHSELLLSCLLDMNYHPYFNNTTRPNNYNGSCIDNMFVKSNSNNLKSFTYSQTLTDHFPFNIGIDLATKMNNNDKNTIYNIENNVKSIFLKPTDSQEIEL
ncbi:Protein of unknown function, partial [Cotesia congregata]